MVSEPCVSIDLPFEQTLIEVCLIS